MIEIALTPASFAGALAYLATVVLAVMAWRASRRRGYRQARHWLLVAGMFLALAAWRLGLGEIRLQDDLRAWALSRGVYEQRHTLQALLTLALIASAGIAIAVITTRRLGRSQWAVSAAGALVLFSFVRFVSLHQLDSLLFRFGPVHLNYVIDVGLTVWAAWLCRCEIAASDTSDMARRFRHRSRS